MLNAVPVDCRTSSILGILNNSIYQSISDSVCYINIFLDFNSSKRSIRIEPDNPILSLERFGFEISSQSYHSEDLSEAYDEISQSLGIVIQHSYSTLLQRMRMIKVNLPVDIPHLIFSQQMKRSGDNLIFNTTDSRFRVMSWNHFFLRDDDEVVIYFIRRKPDKILDESHFRYSAEKSILHYLSCVTTDLISNILDHFYLDVISLQKYESAAVWNRNVWKLYITRAWYAKFINSFYPLCSQHNELSQLSTKYKNISNDIIEKVIKNKNFKSTEYIESFRGVLKNEREIMSRIYEQTRSH